jgi:hypothetical protein
MRHDSAERLAEIRLGAGAVDALEPLLELIQNQPAAS